MKQINLLPKLRQQELRYESVLYSLFVAIWISAISFGLVFGTQIFTKFYLQRQAGVIKADIERLRQQVNKQDNAKTRAEIKVINDTITDYKNLASAAPKWSKVLTAFSLLPPPEITISSFNVDAGKKLINITGFSPSREKVLELYNKILNDNENFYNVDYPLENLVKPTDISFHFSFFVKDELLK